MIWAATKKTPLPLETAGPPQTVGSAKFQSHPVELNLAGKLSSLRPHSLQQCWASSGWFHFRQLLADISWVWRLPLGSTGSPWGPDSCHLVSPGAGCLVRVWLGIGMLPLLPYIRVQSCWWPALQEVSLATSAELSSSHFVSFIIFQDLRAHYTRLLHQNLGLSRLPHRS